MRIDIFLAEHGFVPTRTKAQDVIAKGYVFVNGREVTKPSLEVSIQDYIEVRGNLPFVSRAGEKLQFALEYFHIDPHGLHVLDIGSSTGGFSDVCLQKGASSVTAVDVGSGQFDTELARHPKINLYEQTDIRNFYPQKTFDLIVIDISFISQKDIVQHLKRFCHAHTHIISLIKPQFEVGPQHIGKGGIVKNADSVLDILQKISNTYSHEGFIVDSDIVPCSIQGRDGNQEYFLSASLA